MHVYGSEPNRNTDQQQYGETEMKMKMTSEREENNKSMNQSSKETSSQ